VKYPKKPWGRGKTPAKNYRIISKKWAISAVFSNIENPLHFLGV
jgi:hypothetical protein